MLRSLLIRQAQAEELKQAIHGKSLGDRAKELADYIDALDDRVFGGVLLIGGLVAIFNPLAGAAIAAKSLIPSLGMWRQSTDCELQRVAEQCRYATQNQTSRERRVESVPGSQATQQVNAILTITERALRTTEDEFDPMLSCILFCSRNSVQMSAECLNSRVRPYWTL